MSAFRNVFPRFVVAGLAFAICCFSCKSTPEVKRKQPRLVILYATCTVNKDYLSPYNTSVSYTPNIQTFAKASLVFTKHITEVGQSGPAFASIFSGTQAYKHGVYRHPTKLPSDLYLMSEAYEDNDYETFFWSGHPMASAALNYGQGVKPKNTFDRMLWGGGSDFMEVLQRLKADKNYRAFVMTNFTVTHAPYKHRKLEAFLKRYPAEAKGITTEDIVKYYRIYVKYILELQWNFPETVERLNLSPEDILKLSKVVELLYKTNIWFLDYLFGKVVEQVERFGLLDESLIVFTADHGEILYRKNALFKWGHGFQLVPEVLNVPLIIYSPDLKAKAGYYNKITRSIDIFPTMIGLSGLSLPRQAGIEGVDLSLPILGLDSAPHLLAFSHTSVANKIVLKKDWTLFYNIVPRVDVNLIWVSVREEDMIYRLRSLDTTKWHMQVFDLKHDPIENTNLYDSSNRKIRDMEEKLRTYKERLVRNYVYTNTNEVLTTFQQIEALKSLGYIR